MLRVESYNANWGKSLVVVFRRADMMNFACVRVKRSSAVSILIFCSAIF